MRQDLAAASASGNISAILNAIVGSSALTGDDYIEKSLGYTRAMYYMYIDNYHVRPIDMIDLVDGVLYAEAKSYIREQELNNIQRLQQQKAGR